MKDLYNCLTTPGNAVASRSWKSFKRTKNSKNMLSKWPGKRPRKQPSNTYKLK